MHALILTTTYNNEVIDQVINEKVFSPDEKNRELSIINLYPEITYQEWEGFGGAITESVGTLLNQMPESLSDQVIKDCFSRSGLNYRFIRTHIDSCDFSLSNYSAVEDAEDEELNSFSLEHDDESIIPWIHKAITSCPEKVEIMLTPWSPPAYMKSNGQKNGGGKLLKQFYGRWAEYICKYISEYKLREIPVSMLSVQNEPNAIQKWDSCIFTSEDEKCFLSDYLYPELKKKQIDDIHIYIWDHNKERLFDRAIEIIDEKTNDMVYGLAFHWYSGDHFDAIRLVKQLFPDKRLLFSEGCIEYSHSSAKDELEHAQHYAHDIIGDMNAGMDTFLDWNIVLDEMGGPNHANNLCAAPIVFSSINVSLEKNLSYYYIQHFSKHISKGAVRFATTQYSNELEITAFINSDNSLAIVILNSQEKNITSYLRLNKNIMEVSFPQRSITTITIV